MKDFENSSDQLKELIRHSYGKAAEMFDEGNKNLDL